MKDEIEIENIFPTPKMSHFVVSKLKLGADFPLFKRKRLKRIIL